jgi:hypothetical protein
MTQFNEKQQVQALALIENITWGDMEGTIPSLEEALRFALEATQDWFALWEEQGEDRFGDEFSLVPEQVTELSDQWRQAYVARLLTSIALFYDIPDAPPAPDEHGNPPGWPPPRTRRHPARRPTRGSEADAQPAATVRGTARGHGTVSRRRTRP